MRDDVENLTQIYGVTKNFPHGSKAFKQLQLQDIMVVPAKKPDIEQIVSVSVNAEIIGSHMIDTPCGRSCDGQILTGKKLIVEGKLHQKVEYVAKRPNQPVHAAHFILCFSAFIVIGDEMDFYPEYEVTGYIEDIYVKQLDGRRIFKNVLLLLNAVPSHKI